MRIEGVKFSVTEWSIITPSEHRGEKGSTYWRTVETGNTKSIHIPSAFEWSNTRQGMLLTIGVLGGTCFSF